MDRFIVRVKDIKSAEILEDNERKNPLFSTEKENIDVEDTCDSCVKNFRDCRNDTQNNNCDVENKNANVKTTENKEESDCDTENLGDVPKNFKQWKKIFPWLILNPHHKALCYICCEAVNKQLISLGDMSNPAVINSRRAFVENGFNKWKNALKTFRTYESSNLHRFSINAKANLKESSIVQLLSTRKQKEMEEARIALKKIFTTVIFLVKQGLALRGSNNDERSNLTEALNMRSEDVPELESWLKRTRNVWLHHDVINEIINMLANEVERYNLDQVKLAHTLL